MLQAAGCLRSVDGLLTMAGIKKQPGGALVSVLFFVHSAVRYRVTSRDHAALAADHKHLMQYQACRLSRCFILPGAPAHCRSCTQPAGALALAVTEQAGVVLRRVPEPCRLQVVPDPWTAY